VTTKLNSPSINLIKSIFLQLLIILICTLGEYKYVLLLFLPQIFKLLALPTVWIIFNIIIPLYIYLELSFPYKSYTDNNILNNFLLVAIALLFIRQCATLLTQIPFYPTATDFYFKIKEELPRDRSFKFVDLGSGYGKLLFYLAKNNSSGCYIGFEVSPFLWVLSYLRARLFGYKNVKVHLKSFWKENFSSYDVIYSFLSPEPMPNLTKKLLEDVSNNTLIISNSFPLKGISAKKEIQSAVDKKQRLFFYSEINNL
jgi:SAM-dependent methyltransferase